MKFTGPVVKVGGLIVLCIEAVASVAESPELILDVNNLGVSEAAFGDERWLKEVMGAVVFGVADEGNGRLTKGLKRGVSSSVVVGSDFTFFSGLAFTGLSTMFLNIFNVLDPPVGATLNWGVFIRLLSSSSLSSSSLVN
jgi:hypothetical protein